MVLVLMVGGVFAIWEFEYSDDSLATVDSGGEPWSEIKAFDDMYLNTANNNATNKTSLILDLNELINNVRVGFYEDIVDATGGQCNFTGDCLANLTHNNNSIYHNDLINMIQGNNNFNLTVSCKWFSCETNRTYTLNLTKE